MDMPSAMPKMDPTCAWQQKQWSAPEYSSAQNPLHPYLRTNIVMAHVVMA